MKRSELYIDVAMSPQFHDCDPMQVVWHGNYFKYLEVARCELLRKFNYDYPEMEASGYLWPVVDARIKYIRPLMYRQRLNIRATITEWENRLKIDYLISDADSGQRLTRAHTIQVAVDATTKELQYLCPAVLFERLGVER